MAFSADEFVWNGKSCVQYGLMMYDVDSQDREGGTHTAAGSPQMEHVYRRHRSLLRGVDNDSTLTFSMAFGLCPDRMMSRKYLERFEIERIAAWLTQDTWGWLSICQHDLQHIRYHCMITNLQELSTGWETCGFRCTVVCDSSYAYTAPIIYTYSVKGSSSFNLMSRSSMNMPYAPVIEMSNIKGSTISLKNVTLGAPETKFSGLPSVSKIKLDNETGILLFDDSVSANPYQYFNFELFRLQRGDNKIVAQGAFDLKITCEYPVDVGV